MDPSPERPSPLRGLTKEQHGETKTYARPNASSKREAEGAPGVRSVVLLSLQLSLSLNLESSPNRGRSDARG